MYTSYFGFKENPFNLTPDTRYLFLSRYHKEALDHLRYGVNERKGFVVITGGIGAGKTTLCRAFLNRLDSSTKSALIFNSFISGRELLKAINQEFGIEMPPDTESKKDYLDALNHFLLDNFSKGGNAVLLIDEAQNLSHPVLEQIRMLSNLETEKEKLIQIILVGQPELRELLVAPALKQLDERITVRYNLRHLDHRDIKNYVQHRLIVAESRGELKFTKSAVKKIFTYSKGNPRRINAVCDRALLIAYTKEIHSISGKIIAKAIYDVRGKMTDLQTNNFFGVRTVFAGLFAVLLVATTAFAGWTFREDIARMLPKIQKKPAATKAVNIPCKPNKPPKNKDSLFLDEQDSLSELFRLFNTDRATGRHYFTDDIQLDLVSVKIRPEYYELLKKPFRMQVPNPQPSSSPVPSYLLIQKITETGALIIDTEGKEHAVSRTFILENWGIKISWFFLHENKDIDTRTGMNASDILKIQKILHKAGYMVESTGIFDQSTSQGIAQFQKDSGLDVTGIIDPKIMAVAYLMSKNTSPVLKSLRDAE